MKKEEKVICETCGNENKEIFSAETNQAYGTATDVIKVGKNMYSYSHYGSNFDLMKHFIYKKSGIKLGVLCDKCLSEAKSKGLAKEDVKFNYFG